MCFTYLAPFQQIGAPFKQAVAGIGGRVFVTAIPIAVILQVTVGRRVHAI